MVGKLLATVRSIVFYILFYTGSIPYVLLAIASASPARFKTISRNWSRYHRVCARVLLGIRLDIGGASSHSRVLYAVKHEAFFEAIDVPALFDQPVVFAKAELLKIPGWGIAADRFGVVGVERDAGAKALRKMLTAARTLSAEGRPLVIFPEGTRIPHGTRAPLQAGFAGLYKLLGYPVIPVAVDSGPLYHRRWKRPGTIRYRFGEEIPAGLPRAEIEARVLEAINALNP
ncbi:lysophospholipid acyltransferase family protein [Novosphingobium lentum]|uniref:lysophospholipid acyltransferase family protein n=1 Tax=Novosphingobium lentum TaxID=145287 RepID=UPI00082EB130|nr:lysophospholipid acyltransferase family protein [Novosphingobium lentum]